MTPVEQAEGYVAAVLDGTKPACKWERLACKRHSDDLARQDAADYHFRFDEGRANRFCRLAGLFPHVKGKGWKVGATAGCIKWEPWQYFILCNIFGWVKKAGGNRRFRKASAYIPRKNAKSTLAAVIGWLMFAYDDEPGAEVYSGATSRIQAFEVFKPAREMGRITPDLVAATGTTINAQSLVRIGANAKFEPVIGKPGDGASPHCAIIDEFHEHKTSDLVDTMITGMGARTQPLLLIISTAGDNLAGPCKEDWVACEKILERIEGFIDETHFCIIFTVDEDDAWDSEDALRKANPNFDVSVSGDFLRAQLAVAKRDPRAQSTFKTKHLNCWVSSRSAFFLVEQWQAPANPALKIEDMKGKPCCMGLDLAFKHDLTALMTVFRDGERFAIFGQYYLPRETVNAPENQHFRAWEIAGRITVNDGNITDFTRVQEDCIKIYSEYSAEEFVYDPAHATMLVNGLVERGLNCVDGYGGNGAKLPEWLTEFDAAIRSGRIVHDGDPVLAWAISNCTTKPAKRGMVYLTKDPSDPTKKIDPVIAALLAFGRLSSRVETPAPGVMML